MGTTTLSLDDDTKERLKEYRTPHHESWDHLLNGMMNILPTVGEVKEEIEAAEYRSFEGTLERTGGVIQFFNREVGAKRRFHSTYYPDLETAAEQYEKHEEMLPREPDKVIVGGADEMRTEVEGATFRAAEDGMSVGITIPGAFGGVSSHGNEYDYIGEPVYIWNAGRVVQKGVIEDIIHEEAYTGLKLGHNHSKVMLHHPDDEEREEYKQEHVDEDED